VARIAFSYVGRNLTGRLRHLVKLASARVVGTIQEAKAKVLSSQLNDISHHPSIEPKITEIPDLHSEIFFR